MTKALLFTAVIPLALLAVLALVLISGRLSPTVRRRAEWTTALVALPAFGLYFCWQAWDSVRAGDRLIAGLYVVAAICMLAQVVIAVRSGRLPWARKAAG